MAEQADLFEARTTLAETGWLSLVSTRFRDAVLERCALRRFRRGQVIYEVGDPPGGLWGLVSGRLAIEIAPKGRGPALAHFALPGYWAGEGPAINRMPRRISLLAAQPSVLLNLPLAEFDAIVARDPEGWRWLALLSTMQLDLAIGVIDDLMIRAPRARVAALLLRLAGAREGFFAAPQLADIHVSQERLAQIAVLSRTTLGDMIRQLAEDGVLSLDYGRIRILDNEALARIASL
jgi:CRP/FNR family transcriptional regulator, cyclic AMP receptor protein